MRVRVAKASAKWVVLGVVAFGLAGAAFVAFWLARPVVTVTQVIEGPAISSFYATGSVQPIREYPIKTSNGGTITELAVDKGDHVTKGQILAIVEDPQLKLALDRAMANFTQARLRADAQSSPVLQEFDAKLLANASMLDNARRDEERFKEMSTRGGASKADLDKAADHTKDLWSVGESLKAQKEAARIQLQTDLSIAQANVAAAQRDFERQTLHSPVEGVVLDRPAPLGTRVAVNVNDHVMQIADVRPQNLVMRAQVDEENKADLHLDQVVQMSLYAFPGRIFRGKVQKVYDQADADRRTFEVDVKFDAIETSLAAGMTGELAFIINEEPSTLVAPAQALQAGNVYTVRDGRLAQLDKITVGLRSVERVEIKSGVHAGDWVVITPVQDIKLGSSVRIQTMDPKTAAGLNAPKAESTFKGFN